MKLEKIKKRIKYLKTEIAHERYWDGWVIAGLKKELNLLINKIREINK